MNSTQEQYPQVPPPPVMEKESDLKDAIISKIQQAAQNRDEALRRQQKADALTHERVEASKKLQEQEAADAREQAKQIFEVLPSIARAASSKRTKRELTSTEKSKVIAHEAQSTRYWIIGEDDYFKNGEVPVTASWGMQKDTLVPSSIAVYGWQGHILSEKGQLYHGKVVEDEGLREGFDVEEMLARNKYTIKDLTLVTPGHFSTHSQVNALRDCIVDFVVGNHLEDSL